MTLQKISLPRGRKRPPVNISFEGLQRNWLETDEVASTVALAQLEGKKVSLLGKLKEATAELVESPADPWLAPLQRVRGKLEFDGQERVSSQTLLDMLEVPQRSRTAGTYRRLAKLMTELGWSAVRVRDFSRNGYREQVRGYVRDARDVNASRSSRQ